MTIYRFGHHYRTIVTYKFRTCLSYRCWSRTVRCTAPSSWSSSFSVRSTSSTSSSPSSPCRTTTVRDESEKRMKLNTLLRWSVQTCIFGHKLRTELLCPRANNKETLPIVVGHRRETMKLTPTTHANGPLVTCIRHSAIADKVLGSIIIMFVY